MPGPNRYANMKKQDYTKTQRLRLRQGRKNGRAPSTVDAATARRTMLAERKKKKTLIKLSMIKDKNASKESKMLID